MASELALGSELAWTGRFEHEVRLHGQPLTAVGRWEQVCWVSDEEVDYLELSLDLDQGVVIERHILLGRVPTNSRSWRTPCWESARPRSIIG